MRPILSESIFALLGVSQQTTRAKNSCQQRWGSSPYSWLHLLVNDKKPFPLWWVKPVKKKKILSNKWLGSSLYNCLHLHNILLDLGDPFFVRAICCIPVDTRRRFNVYKTSIRRRRRRIDVL